MTEGVRAIGNKMKEVSHLTGPTSLIGLIFVVWMESRSSVSQADFDALRNTVSRIEIEQQRSRDEYLNILKQLDSVDDKLNSLLRLVCTTSGNKPMAKASGAC